MNWTILVLAGLIAAPLLGALVAGLTRSSRVRTVTVVLTALLTAAGGVGLVWLTAQSGEPGHVWKYSAPARWTEAADCLEYAIILLVIFVALKIRNAWIALFALLQLLTVAAGHFVPGRGDVEIQYFLVDNLTRIMLLVSSCVGAAILIFSIGYMKQHQEHVPEGAGSLRRFYFVFLSFLGLMIGLVVSNQFALFSFFWEGTTLCSYALIGQDGGEARRINAVRALTINTFGGAVMAVGILLLKYRTGGETFTELFAQSDATLLAAVLLCIAAFTKSALFPFQSWLLGAMVAPTPVSAMLHAATMVKAGVYLVMRLTPNFLNDGRVMMGVAFAGALSFVGGALLACTQSNGKRVLAYSTISNLGLVVACAGIDSPLAYAAGLSIISFHAISKGLLFLCVGRIEQKIGSRDIEDMDGLMFKMPFTSMVILLGMMSMLLPPFGMLLSKWLAIEATIRSPFLLIFMALGSALTVFFWAKWIGRIQHTGYHEKVPREEIPFSMRFSLSLMALMVLGSGLLTMWIFSTVFVPMSETVFQKNGALDWNTLYEASNFSAVMIFGALALAGVLHYLFFWRRFRHDWVRLPFLCGENVSSDEVQSVETIRSYDFHSVGGRIEHSHVSSYYFRGIINERLMTGALNWSAWLIIVVLMGNTLAAEYHARHDSARGAAAAVAASRGE